MKRLSSLGIAVIATLVLLAGILLFLASPLSAKKTAEVHLPEIQDRLPEHTGAAVPRELTQVEVNPDTVQAVISTLNRPDSYSRTLQVFQFWDGGGRTAEIRVWVRSGTVRLNIVGAEREINYLLDGDVLTLWYGSDMSHRYTYNKADARLGDSLQRIPTYEDILSLDPTSIRDAGCTCTESGKWRILVSTVDPDFNYLDIYYVSLDTGLLVGAEQWDGDTLIYRMTAGEADLSAPSDQLFLLSS
ncbi:MAG: hypothetical protein IKX47_07215 [Oscillospiraceae bacterium]|nr:hypothetical protein [Oscillospiraceae bacterium]